MYTQKKRIHESIYSPPWALRSPRGPNRGRPKVSGGGEPPHGEGGYPWGPGLGSSLYMRYIYMYMRYIYVYVYAYTCINKCMNQYTVSCPSSQAHTQSMSSNGSVSLIRHHMLRIHVYMYENKRIYIPICVCISYTYTHTHIYTYIHIYIYISAEAF